MKIENEKWVAIHYTLKDDDGNEIGSLNFSLTAQGNDTYVRFNSATQLIEGLEKLPSGGIKLTGNLYNRYITSGDWFKIPVGESVINITEEILSAIGDRILSIAVSKFIRKW